MLRLRVWEPPAVDLFELSTELQASGMRWLAEGGFGLHRRGGAGPSDHKAVKLDGKLVMVPIHTGSALGSRFEARGGAGETPFLYRDGQPLMPIEIAPVPRFYKAATAEGVPYWKIATLHADNVLASTLLQKCVRYGNQETRCQFCAIGQSLASGATIVEKSPAQLAEVAKAAVELDGVEHMVLTTGTPKTDDRGAMLLARAVAAIRGAVDLPVQAQCEPPVNFSWFQRLHDAGVATLGMHLEAVTEPVRKRIMPGKAEVPVAVYLEAFVEAVKVFGRGQVTTYILAGLGDSEDDIVVMCELLAALGVYPFVVPFVPIAGTRLAHHPPPSAAMMSRLLKRVAGSVARHGLRSEQIAAGCGRCGACSTLRTAEAEVAHA
ncbi:MAG TPA: MSMEG_0568 family radical SAM protein [Polyangiales bacterium]|nr:MSMEG_0568 family radical SAM protein [Polyangiales bacterium]